MTFPDGTVCDFTKGICWLPPRDIPRLDYTNAVAPDFSRVRGKGHGGARGLPVVDVFVGLGSRALQGKGVGFRHIAAGLATLGVAIAAAPLIAAIGTASLGAVALVTAAGAGTALAGYAAGAWVAGEEMSRGEALAVGIGGALAVGMPALAAWSGLAGGQLTAFGYLWGAEVTTATSAGMMAASP